jgi:maltose alpha-D-glucosyltransferase/alpha-amylase
VLAFLRVLDEGDPGTGPGEGEPETILCVNNLSSRPQATCLSLPGQGGARMVDCFGGGGFPNVPQGETMTITLGSRDFYWLQLRPDPAAAPASTERWHG